MSDPEWQERITSVLRQLQIIVGSLVAGCLFFLVIVLVVSSGMAAAEGLPLISYIAIGFAVMALLARITIPRAMLASGRRKIRRQGGHAAAADGLLQLLPTQTIVACAVLEGATFFLLVAYLVEGWLPALIVAVALIVLLGLHMPTRSRAIHWIEDQLGLLLQEQQLGG